MASSKEYAAYIMEQLEIIDYIKSRKMMGEYIFYYREKVFGGIYDDRFLVKITETSKKLMPDACEEIPYDGAKPMLMVDNPDNRDLLKELITGMYDELPMPKVKKKK